MYTWNAEKAARRKSVTNTIEGLTAGASTSFSTPSSVELGRLRVDLYGWLDATGLKPFFKISCSGNTLTVTKTADPSTSRVMPSIRLDSVLAAMALQGWSLEQITQFFGLPPFLEYTGLVDFITQEVTLEEEELPLED